MRAIFCRRQQQDNRAGRSNFEPARHGTGNGLASGRRVYYLIHDLPRIAGPSRCMFKLVPVPGSSTLKLDCGTVDDLLVVSSE
jgi:hypothetical protein